MKVFKFFLCLCIFVTFQSSAQYRFTHLQEIKNTPVKDQAKTGTCWSFATASFIESELLKAGFENIDLSEMFVVRNIYKDKARNYILRQGEASFSQGSLAHDLINAVEEYGLVPESVFSGLLKGENFHNHDELERGLKGFLDGVLLKKPISTKWEDAFDGILDAYLGEVPEVFEYEGKKYTPKSFVKYLGINSNKFKSITSFTHHPFGKAFILEVPDNYSNGYFYNVQLDKMMEIIDNSLDNGYSVIWDGDSSERGFSGQAGLAVLPAGQIRDDVFIHPGKEINVTQELRQKLFESLATTDDHLMHIVGTAKDQNGTKYYIIKNSWGKISEYKGYLYMSEAYVRMKTIFVMVNEEALSAE